MRVIVIVCAKNNFLFTTVKHGSIIFLSKTDGGGIEKVIADTKGLGVHFHEESGERLHGEEAVFEGKNGSIWYMLTGAIFIGLGSVVSFDLVITNEDGTTSVVKASSLFYKGEYYLNLKDLETKGQFPVDILLKVTTETLHAKKTMAFRGKFLTQILDPVKAIVRDFTSQKDPFDLIGQQNEGHLNDVANSGFIDLVFTVNNTVRDKVSGKMEGNPGIKKSLGQKIIAVNLTSIQASNPEIRKAMEAKKKAELEGNTAIEAANKALEKAIVDAKKTVVEAGGERDAKKALSDARKYDLEQKMVALKNNTSAVVRIDVMESIRDSKITTAADEIFAEVDVSGDKGQKVPV